MTLAATIMKTLFLITLFIRSLIFGQKPLILELYGGDCRIQSGATIGHGDTIYFTRDDKIIKEIPVRHLQYWPITIKDFLPGEYLVLYKDFAGKKKSQAFSVSNVDLFKLYICPDVFSEYIFPFENFTANDRITIDYSSLGCFHFASEMLTLTKKDSSFIITLKTPKNKPLKIILDKDKKDAFNRFYNELLTLSDSDGCTTTDTYSISTSKGFKLKRIDGSCFWNGFYYLKKALLNNRK